MTATTTATTATIATALDTDPKTLRKFLRDSAQGVGKGKRYALPGTKRDLDTMRKAFLAWGEAKAVANAKVDRDEVTTDEGAEVEPTDADIEAIADEV